MLLSYAHPLSVAENSVHAQASVVVEVGKPVKQQDHMSISQYETTRWIFKYE
jgi:hypothetical protein